MDIQYINAEQEFMDVMSSIAKNPESWGGWTGLHIVFAEAGEAYAEECFLWAKSIIESYLGQIEGRVFFCFGRHVHVICRGVPIDVLEQTGRQVCDMVFSESGVICEYHLYDLAQYGREYYLKSGICDDHSNLLLVGDRVRDGEALHAGYEHVFEVENTSGRESGDLIKVKVMLVEDDPVTRWMVRSILKNQCDFATAPCANKAFAMYSSFQPDLVFLDIGLPDQEGTSVLEWIIRNDPGARVVMFSGNDNLDNIAKALNAGASGFVSKPFLREDLLHYLQDVR